MMMKDGMNHKITFSYIANSEKAQYENSSPKKRMTSILF